MESSKSEVHCPKCGSTSLYADKKGFSGRKAVAGALLTGGIGLVAGTIGSNKLEITCLNCGAKFKPGQGKKESGATVITDNRNKYFEQRARGNQLLKDPRSAKRGQANILILSVFFFLSAVICLMCGLNVTAGILALIGALLLFLYFKLRNS